MRGGKTLFLAAWRDVGVGIGLLGIVGRSSTHARCLFRVRVPTDGLSLLKKRTYGFVRKPIYLPRLGLSCQCVTSFLETG